MADFFHEYTVLLLLTYGHGDHRADYGKRTDLFMFKKKSAPGEVFSDDQWFRNDEEYIQKVF